MRAAALVLGLALATPTPSFAHCYSIWNYSRPQRCSTQVAEEATPTPPEKPKQLAPFTTNQWDTIILTPMPGRTDEQGRADAIEILKEVMGK